MARTPSRFGRRTPMRLRTLFPPASMKLFRIESRALTLIFWRRPRSSPPRWGTAAYAAHRSHVCSIHAVTYLRADLRVRRVRCVLVSHTNGNERCRRPRYYRVQRPPEPDEGIENTDLKAAEGALF